MLLTSVSTNYIPLCNHGPFLHELYIELENGLIGFNTKGVDCPWGLNPIGTKPHEGKDIRNLRSNIFESY